MRKKEPSPETCIAKALCDKLGILLSTIAAIFVNVAFSGKPKATAPSSIDWYGWTFHVSWSFGNKTRDGYNEVSKVLEQVLPTFPPPLLRIVRDVPSYRSFQLASYIRPRFSRDTFH
ncbi:hypothetical protein NE237_021350 [Protea cynaroides]|uniref:Uncharacterized protein n=1 Tax=Protea cynaroides TaxID=273540 RepID=A0A9Q0H8Y0_9MAGN|nr:hypothetical protein NE237_021350 [Protea cynaroides]